MKLTKEEYLFLVQIFFDKEYLSQANAEMAGNILCKIAESGFEKE